MCVMCESARTTRQKGMYITKFPLLRTKEQRKIDTILFPHTTKISVSINIIRYRGRQLFGWRIAILVHGPPRFGTNGCRERRACRPTILIQVFALEWFIVAQSVFAESVFCPQCKTRDARAVAQSVGKIVIFFEGRI